MERDTSYKHPPTLNRTVSGQLFRFLMKQECDDEPGISFDFKSREGEETSLRKNLNDWDFSDNFYYMVLLSKR